MDVQQGTVLEYTRFYHDQPRLCLNPLKIEERENWKLVDSLIARAISVIAVLDERSQIPFDELVRRIHREAHIDMECLITNIPKILRDPPNSLTGNIRRLKFRD